MHGRTLATISLLLVGGLMTACNDSTKTKLTMLTEENHELRDQLEERDRALDATTSDLREANRLLREQQELIVVTTTTPGNPFAGIEGVSTTVDGNEITVSMEGDILFESGRSSLRSPAKQSLQQIASILNNDYQGQMIVIAGHTDSDPIRKSGYKSNHHLGFERGWAVYEYLTSRGVDTERIAVSSYGPNSPLSSKKESRRVEIVVADAN
ncbi:MAG: OmpA family protein [Planctomycetota bacterium]|nr:OmpA family protein [Planctomycetota bacterium]